MQSVHYSLYHSHLLLCTLRPCIIAHPVRLLEAALICPVKVVQGLVKVTLLAVEVEHRRQRRAALCAAGCERVAAALGECFLTVPVQEYAALVAYG